MFGYTFKTFCNIASDYLIYYDEYFVIRQNPLPEQISFKAFVAQTNKKYNKNYTLTSVKYYFKLIVTHGLRSPLPEKQNKKNVTDYSYEIQQKYLQLYQEVKNIYSNCRAQGENISLNKIFEKLAVKYNRSSRTISKNYSKGKEVHESLKHLRQLNNYTVICKSLCKKAYSHTKK